MSVARLFRWIISSGHRKSFHTLTQVSTPSTSTAGRECGSRIRQ
ncbi:Uncharacterised protein [Mycobacterium tuberculosis]|uniref:Uncharacterized protein n=1 Tax=Mycobacterium tuberculosis TaxID=1773 RepID=A0A916L815_MYCTX|nr:Uncharacterised protein [Mycobacterium tuberculosis]